MLRLAQRQFLSNQERQRLKVEASTSGINNDNVIESGSKRRKTNQDKDKVKIKEEAAPKVEMEEWGVNKTVNKKVNKNDKKSSSPTAEVKTDTTKLFLPAPIPSFEGTTTHATSFDISTVAGAEIDTSIISPTDCNSSISNSNSNSNNNNNSNNKKTAILPKPLCGWTNGPEIWRDTRQCFYCKEYGDDDAGIGNVEPGTIFHDVTVGDGGRKRKVVQQQQQQQQHVSKRALMKTRIRATTKTNLN